jgi:hypothetical protein
MIVLKQLLKELKKMSKEIRDSVPKSQRKEFDMSVKLHLAMQRYHNVNN